MHTVRKKNISNKEPSVTPKGKKRKEKERKEKKRKERRKEGRKKIKLLNLKN